jgi:cell shape-determining protein MreC
MAKSNKRSKAPGIVIPPGTPKQLTLINQVSALSQQFNDPKARKRTLCKVTEYVDGEPVSTKVIRNK